MALAHYKNGQLYLEDCALKSLAEQFQTPLYVYSKAAILHQWHQFEDAFADIAHLSCFAVKANNNLTLLNILARCGSGFDIVSQGELEQVLTANGDASKIVYSGVGKRRSEIKRAMKANIFCFDVESLTEIELINALAISETQEVQIALRINPDIDAKTHVHIATGRDENKFGIPVSKLEQIAAMLKSMPKLKLIGLASHIGSQLTELAPIKESILQLRKHSEFMLRQGFHLTHINIGGGLGIKYHLESPPSIYEYAKVVREALDGLNLKVILEPGRILMGNTGLLLTEVQYIKDTAQKHFAIVDAGMNDLIRPLLYDAYHEIMPVEKRRGEELVYDIAGPLCESADFLAHKREMDIYQGDLLAILSAGAYGYSMASNYNSRLKPAEVLVDGDRAYLIRQRESYEDLLARQPKLFDLPLT